MERKNINRGFKKLRVWQDAVSLHILAYKIFTKFPFEVKKVAANSIDAAHSISRNISEGETFILFSSIAGLLNAKKLWTGILTVASFKFQFFAVE